MYLMFVAYYNSMIFSKICSEGGDFLYIFEIALFFYFQISNRVSRFGAKVFQIDPKWDKSRTFSDPISVHFGAVAPKCTEIGSEKVPDLSLLGSIRPSFEPNRTSASPTQCSNSRFEIAPH